MGSTRSVVPIGFHRKEHKLEQQQYYYISFLPNIRLSGEQQDRKRQENNNTACGRVAFRDRSQWDPMLPWDPMLKPCARSAAGNQSSAVSF